MCCRISPRCVTAIRATASYAAPPIHPFAKVPTTGARWVCCTPCSSRSAKPICAYASKNICALACTRAFSTPPDVTYRRTTMGADLSRVRLNPLLDYAGVELKQGGLLLDADANELMAVVDRRL